MKRIVITTLLVASGLGLFAQPANKAKDLLKSKKLGEAKTEIDKVVANEKGAKDPEAWYVKSKVYSELANDSSLASSAPTAREESFEALKKYTQLDDKKLIFLTLDNYKPIWDIYQGYFKTGAAFYNTNNYADAYNNFKKCLEVSEYMSGKGWSTLKLDTNVILYAGISADKTNKKDDAATYYSKLADAKVSDTNYVEIYRWLIDYYNGKNDSANTSKYLALGESIYPKDKYWPDMELDLARKKADKKQLFDKYEEIIAKDPSNSTYPYTYGIELYQEAYKEDITQRPANASEMIDKAVVKIKKSLELNPDNSPANLVLGQILYNQGFDYSTKLKAIKTPATGKLKPEDQKTKDDLKAQMIKKFDEAIPYLEKLDQAYGSQGKLKMDEKKSLKDAYDLLITIYDQKGLKDKLKIYEDKFNSVDKAH